MATPTFLGRAFARLRFFLTLTVACGFSAALHGAPVLKILFLGDNGHHKPAERLRDIGPALMARGIQVVYTEDLSALTLENLRRYDALMIYGNIDSIPAEQDNELFTYVNEGGGLVALHCASYCFRNSPRYVAMVGAQFKSHKSGVFRTKIVAPDHPVMKGFPGFESWDETYVHTAHNENNRTLLEMRETEPWTWTRAEGKGRVFYTAWGHDERTWTNPGFHDLVERGIRFAAGQNVPEALANRPKIAPFEIIDQPGIVYYPPGQRSQGDGVWQGMQKPLTPAESMQHIVVPGGFELQLVASEPDIKKPIAMNWDERGRLWIVETLDYPNRLLPRGTPGRDRIVICDDTNGDGQMDKFTVFADGLNIPTGLTFSNGGVIVHHAPDTLFMKDTDGDDRADLKEVLFTGWGRNDTHAGPNNLQYGFDNWIWGIVGYSAFNGTVGGKAHKFGQAFYRFKADGSQLEFIRNNNNNSWGLGFTEEGYVFGSTANNNPSVYMAIPDELYQAAGLPAKTLPSIAESSRFFALTGRVRQVDVHWGYTAAAGHALYTARSYPKEYWNRVAFVAEPTGHLVGQFNVVPSGSGFRSVSRTNLVYSDDEWFAPVMAEVGPDGAVWIIDWYNYIVQHNPTPKNHVKGEGNAYETDLRDQRFGRIYRIAWKDAKPAKRLDLKGATPQQLIETLRHENLLWRRHAQRLLVERGRKDIVPALIELTKDQSVDEIGLNVGVIHALWTLQGLNAYSAEPAAVEAAEAALKHPSAGVRRTALSVLPRSVRTGEAIRTAGLLNDADARLRLTALLALAEVPASALIGEEIFKFVATPREAFDQLMLDAATIAANAHRKSFIAAATPEQLNAARALRTAPAESTATVDDFESIKEGLGQWSQAQLGGQSKPQVSVDTVGRRSERSLRVALSESGEALVVKKFAVTPGHRYVLNGYIKTEDVKPSPRAIGAFIGVPQLQEPRRALSAGIKDTTGWVQARVQFETTTQQEVLIACGIGGGGTGASGTAWFDDLVLTDLGAAGADTPNPLPTVLSHLLKQSEGSSTADESRIDSTYVELGVTPDVMKFDRPEVKVAAGQRVRFNLRNPDHMQHNAVIVMPDAAERVGALADAMMTDPDGLKKNYVPESNDVLFATPLVDPGDSYSGIFTAPDRPGRYPILCTFPGHWRMMQSVLVVTPE